jgi:hypothetical protein
MALDLASAVTTHLDAVARRPGRGGLAVRSVNILLGIGTLLTLAPVPVLGVGQAPPNTAEPVPYLRAPISHGDCAISRRTVMNNAG